MQHVRKVVLGLMMGLAMTALCSKANAIEVDETATFSASADDVWDVVKHLDFVE